MNALINVADYNCVRTASPSIVTEDVFHRSRLAGRNMTRPGRRTDDLFLSDLPLLLLLQLPRGTHLSLAGFHRALSLCGSRTQECDSRRCKSSIKKNTFCENKLVSSQIKKNKWKSAALSQRTASGPPV